ncbi:hypothetical protein SAMN04488128_105370 [Chitinophaga eiseniae]|uniref:YD repeat-containing protein n=2 Tax=Chitinophaga eiseniae TaxID=634771 RepID=A0A1T4TL77_9BACT|nr:hypothetical protein SAMN04488128_105370 [Chitinophaga eiseniae]
MTRCEPMCGRAISCTMKNILGVLLSVSTLFGTLSVRAQGQRPPLKEPVKVIPSSPEASALGRYGEWPVSLHTGTANISVPFYTISLRDLSLPVQLSYHASGIKVEDVASWVGTGWALEAGGMITRTVQGIPDDEMNGYMRTRTELDNFPKVFDARQPRDYKILSEASQTGATPYDTEPDWYFFNFAGKSGKFFIDKDGSMKSMPASNLKVIHYPAFFSGSLSERYWEILDDNGVTYFLGQDGAQEKTTYQDDDKMVRRSNINGWYLNKIVSPNKQDSIVFTYDDKSEFYNVKGSQALVLPQAVPNDFLTTTMLENAGFGYYGTTDPGAATNAVSGKTQLRAITWKDGRIDFHAKTRRADISGVLLDSIVVRNAQQDIINKYEFKYDNNTNRPYLLSIVQRPSPEVTQDYYSFEYDKNSMPNRFSDAQDRWGYYNGANSNTNMIESHPAMTKYKNPFPVAKADRVASNQAAVGSLTRIKYPTGGSTSFTYEVNRYDRTAEPPKEIPGYYGSGGFNSTASYLSTRHIEHTVDARERAAGKTTISIKVNNYMRGVEPEDAWLPRFIIYSIDKEGKESIFYQWNAHDNKMTSDYTYNKDGTENLSYNSEGYLESFPEGKIRFVLEIVCIKRWGECPVFPRMPDISVNYEYMKWYPPTTESQAQYNTAGGIRIKEMTIYSHDNKPLIRKEYTYTKMGVVDNKPQEISSGTLISTPVNYSISRRALSCGPIYDANGQQACSFSQIMVGTFSSTPVTVLGMTGGGYVGYDKVTEKVIDYGKNTGRTDYYYSNAYNGYSSVNMNGIYNGFEADGWGLQFPLIDRSYARGLLLQKDVFAIPPSGAEKLVAQEVNKYNLNDKENDPNLVTSRYLRVVRLADSLKTCCARTYTDAERIENRVYEFGYSYYDVKSPWVTLASKTMMNDSVTTTTNYSYNSSNQLISREERTNSRNETAVISLKYPSDKVWAGQDPKGIYQKMIDRNMILPVVEEENIVNGVQRNKTTVSYRDWYNNGRIIRPDTVFTSNLGKTMYPAVIYKSYDPLGNIRSMSAGSNFTSSIIWSYNDAYPVMKADNAEANEIYYEGFENSTLTGVASDVSHQGNKSFRGTLSVNFVRPDNKEYLLSYWKYTGGSWKKVIQPLTVNNPTVNATEPIDDVTIYPKGAAVSTYSYLPLVGMTSENSPVNILRKYSYDKLGRLQIVRDANNRILKMLCYNYYGQATDCLPK